jgi:HxlR-like helix-turn-helix protein
VSAYGQFCPVSKAMELLDERWTMLVVRELLLGSRHFNELRRGVPQMSPALLSKRACLQTDLRSLAMLWRGDLGWPQALRSGRVEVHGPAWARRAVPRWFGQSPLAAVPRPAAVP